MEWKLGDSGESLATHVDLGRVSVCGIVYHSIVTRRYTCMIWVLDYHAPIGTDHLAGCIRKENFTTAFTAVQAAEKAIGLKVDELQSQSAVWQEV